MDSSVKLMLEDYC